MELKLVGKQEFMEKEIVVIEGGFGEGQRTILARDVAVIHNITTPDVNKLINRNITRFKENVDYIDLNCQSRNDQQLLDFGFTNMQIGKAKNIYLLSERGYAKVIKIMDTDLAWQVHDKLIDEYFTMRKQLRESILDSYQIEDPIERAKAWIKEQEEKKVLLETIEGQIPKVEYHDNVLNVKNLMTTTVIAKDLGMSARALNKVLKENRVIFKRGDVWIPYKDYQWLVPDYCDVHTSKEGYNTLKWTQKGRQFIMDLLKEKMVG